MPRYVLRDPDTNPTEGLWGRTVSLPVNAAILEALDVDEDATVELEGTIVGKHSDKNSMSIEFEIRSVECYGKGGKPDGMKDQHEYNTYRLKGGGKS